MKTLKIPFLFRLALALVSIIALGYLAYLGQSILAPMFMAFLLAILFVPMANFTEKKFRFSRSLSTVLAVLVMIIFFGAVITFFGTQLSSFVSDFPALEKQIVKTFHELQLWISRTFNLNFDRQMEYINQGLEKLLSSTGVILGVTVSMFSSVLGFAAFTILFFIFILNYRRTLYSFLTAVFAEKHLLQVESAVQDAQQIIKQYITGLLIQVLIVSILASVLLSVLGVKYAILLGVLTGFLNIIPYIGIFFSCLFACLISFATGGHNTLFVLLGYVGIHAIDANITLPLVVGSKVKINALFSFIALLIGEKLWGISGMFLSIPFLAMLKIIFERVDELKPWAKLMGEESSRDYKVRRQKLINKIKRREKGKDIIS